MNVILYTTSGCHLCEQAAELLSQLHQERALTVEMIDIADDDNLIDRYGVRIPVVRASDKDEELGWPFDLTTLRGFLER